MSQGNGTSFSLHVENIKHKKYIFLIGCISSSLDYFSITSLFQHVKLCVTIFLSLKSAMYNFTANLVERNSILTLSYRSTRSWSLIIIQYFFKCCFLLDAVQEKYSYVSYATLHFICRIVEFNRNYMKCTKFGRLEGTRSSHEEFAYLLYNSTENTWNSQNLAS